MQGQWLAVLLGIGTVFGATVPLITVDVRINGRGPFRFVVDTGAESCSVLPGVWEAAGLRAEYRVELVSSTGGSELVPATKQATLEAAGVSAGQVEVLVHDLPAVRAVAPGVVGVLGQSFLRRFEFVLDYAEGSLRIGTRLEGPRLPLVRREHRMLVRARAGRRKLELVLDSGASNLVLQGPGGSEAALLAGNTGSRAVRRGRTRQLTVGGVVLRDVETAWVPGKMEAADGLLPASLFPKVYVNWPEAYAVLGR